MLGWDFKSHTHVPIQLLKTWGIFQNTGKKHMATSSHHNTLPTGPPLLESAPAGALPELPSVEVLQLLGPLSKGIDRGHRCLGPWKGPAELCPVSHAKGSLQKTEPLVPVLKPADHFWKPCCPSHQHSCWWVTDFLDSRAEEEKWQGQSFSRQRLRMDMQVDQLPVSGAESRAQAAGSQSASPPLRTTVPCPCLGPAFSLHLGPCPRSTLGHWGECASERNTIESIGFHPMSTPRWDLGAKAVMFFFILNKTGVLAHLVPGPEPHVLQNSAQI